MYLQKVRSSMDPFIVNWIIIPVLIIIARIFDVSIGTLRIIFVTRGSEKIAAILGFFEVIIWLIAISQVMKNLNNVACYIAYGTGFGFGTLIGGIIEKKLAVGIQIIRIITTNQLQTLQMALRDEGYGVTTTQGYGGKGPVNIIFVVAHRKQVGEVLKIVNSIEPQSFITTQSVDTHSKGYFSAKRNYFTSFLKK